MKYRVILAVLLVSMLFFLLFWGLAPVNNPSKPDFFVGVDTAYDDVEDIKKLVDEVKAYTNLFGIGSSGITYNRTKLDEVCQYVYDSGLYFIVYKHPTEKINQTRWIADAKQKWGDRFLGVYLFDEIGGRQIDGDPYRKVEEADNYTDAANKYVEIWDEYLRGYTEVKNDFVDLPLFTADYALYWFDYEIRFDVVLSEFGWNHSRLLSVALNRGAARMQHKDWGVMITWTYRHPPHLESGDELYYDMALAYLSGAKYVVVFSHPMEDSWDETLTEKHLDAMKRFWRYVQTNPQRPQIEGSTSTRTAYILPKDYGWGFRGSEDKVWGLWVDELSTKIGTDLNYLLHTHHISLDIIYDDPKHYSEIHRYNKLFFWNGTVT